MKSGLYYKEIGVSCPNKPRKPRLRSAHPTVEEVDTYRNLLESYDQDMVTYTEQIRAYREAVERKRKEFIEDLAEEHNMTAEEVNRCINYMIHDAGIMDIEMDYDKIIEHMDPLVELIESFTGK